jgi:hypothetical protein
VDEKGHPGGINWSSLQAKGAEYGRFGARYGTLGRNVAKALRFPARE